MLGHRRSPLSRQSHQPLTPGSRREPAKVCGANLSQNAASSERRWPHCCTRQAGRGRPGTLENLRMALPSSLQQTVERAQALRAQAQRARADAARVAAASRDTWERAQKALKETKEVLGHAEDRTAKALRPTMPLGNAQ